MKKVRLHIIRILYGAAVFIAALFISGHFLSGEATATAGEMSAASLPVVTMMTGDVAYNELYGSVDERTAGRCRPPLTLLPESREAALRIQPYGGQIDRVVYEVRTLSGSRLIEKTQAELPAPDTDGSVPVVFTLKNLIEPEEEYLLTVVLTQGEREIRYDTRICCSDAEDPESAVAFVQEFHDKALEGTDLDYLSAYLEPEGESDSLAVVDIHASVEQVAFCGLQPSETIAPVYTVTAAEGSSYLVDGWYVVEMADSGDESRTAHYFCHEYYRISRGTDRFHLIAFRRTMQQIFDPQASPASEDTLPLGVGDGSPETMQNEAGTVTAFVVDGSLYAVDTGTDTVACIFSFADADSTDRREVCPSHNIRILSVTEEGDIDFLVYGYMNRGRHEGSTGVAAYHYAADSHGIREQVYLACDGSYDLLADQIGSGAYQNTAGNLYLALYDHLWEVDTRRGRLRLADASGSGNLVTSEDGRMTAWKESSGDIVYTDLEDFSQQRISPEEDEVLTPVGFLKDDLIVGTARTRDGTRDAAGLVFLPMYRLQILNHSLEVLEDYEQDPYYISEAVIEDSQITLHRVEKTEQGYQEAEDDQIVDTARQTNKAATAAAVTSNTFGQTWSLAVSGLQPENLRYARTKELVYAGTTDRTEELVGTLESMEADGIGQEQHYYVYGIYGYERMCTSAADAVRKAAEEGMSCVMTEDGRYAWKDDDTARCELEGIGEEEDYRSLVQEGTMTAAGACLSAMVRYGGGSADAATLLEEGEDAGSILSESVPGCTVLNLSGCSMAAVLYYPAAGVPVLAAVQEGAVLIIGYGPRNVAVWNPESGTTEFWLRSRAEREFTAAGSRFVTYLPAEE